MPLSEDGGDRMVKSSFSDAVMVTLLDVDVTFLCERSGVPESVFTPESSKAHKYVLPIKQLRVAARSGGQIQLLGVDNTGNIVNVLYNGKYLVYFAEQPQEQ